MSIAFLITALGMARDGIAIENDMFFFWALFAIADALWARIIFGK